MKIALLITLLIFSFSSFADEPSEVKPSLKKWQEIKPISINGKKARVLKTSKTVDVPEISEAKTCEVEISSDYWQEDDRLKVETQIENGDCGASQGLYIVNVGTRNKDGETRTSKYQEAWSRDDFQAVIATHVYSMNGDTELVRVRLRTPFNGACLCGNSAESAQ